MRLKWQLVLASLKMFFRQREAIVWTLLLPIFMILLFSLVDFDGVGKVRIGIVGAEAGEDLIRRLEDTRAVELYQGIYEEECRHLRNGERDLVAILPRGGDISYRGIRGLTNEASADGGRLALLILQNAVDEVVFAGADVPARIAVQTEKLQGRSLSYIDFLIPGVIAMSIMQMGVFGVAFSFVSLKKRGILRRLSVTPIRPNDFILAQIVMRLIVVILQVSVLVGLGVFFLNLQFAGNMLTLLLVGALGAFVFLGIGFAIAGISKSEDQVAPLANVVVMPMIVLSGVFFSRSNLPDFIHMITEVLPLTYLADGIRSVVIDGSSIIAIVPQIIGLAAWLLISSFIAIRFFRWE